MPLGHIGTVEIVLRSELSRWVGGFSVELLLSNRLLSVSAGRGVGDVDDGMEFLGCAGWRWLDSRYLGWGRLAWQDIPLPHLHLSSVLLLLLLLQVQASSIWQPIVAL